jgi:hypothetical protein
MSIFDTEEFRKLAEDRAALGNKIDAAMQAYNKGDITGSENLLRSVGAFGGFAGDALARTFDFVTPDMVTDPVVDMVEKGITAGMDASGATAYLQDNPRLASNLEGGLGMLDALGLKGVTQSLPKTMGADRGSTLSTPSNYIDNFYGIDNPDAPNTLAENVIEKGISSTKGLGNVTGVPADSVLGAMIPLVSRLNLPDNPKQQRALARKFVGFAGWAKNSVFPALKNMTSAEAKALWREQGINKNGQKLIKDLLDAAEARSASTGIPVQSTREFEKAVAQSIYMRYIGEQAGRKGNYNKAYTDIFDKSTFGGIMPNSKGAYVEASGALENLANKTGSLRRVNVSEAQRAKAYDYIQDIWGMDADSVLVVKKPKGTGGDHASSVYYSKMNGPVRALYKNVENRTKKQATTEDLFNELVEKKDLKRYQGIRILNESLEDAKENGLWITQSASGRAIVEGGINRVTLLKPTGEMISFISDEHNFLENLPIIGPQLKKALPVREMTITPPIVGHIKGDKKYTTREAIAEEGNKADVESLKKLAEAKPSKEAVAQAKKEMRKQQAGVGMLTGSLVVDPDMEEQQEGMTIEELIAQLPN